MGLTRNRALKLLDITKHHYYYEPKSGKKGRPPTLITIRKKGDRMIEVDEQELIDEMILIKSNPETDYGYKAMTAELQLQGYMINKKKVYRLMKHYQLLKLKFN